MRTSGVADLAGRVLAGRYRLLAPIGTGASGRVYVAWDTRLKRRVAVKVLHAALADDAGFIRRFGAEAQVAASLNHRNIVTVYDWGAPEAEGDTPFIVLELLEGGSLRGMLDSGTRLSPAQAAAVGRSVAAALEYAHARGLVHRDVKPANLLFDEHGVVRVADFGLARALAEASWTEPAGAVLGTARYAAPEQVQGTVDSRSDLYSLALVLVEAVTGTVPFAAETSLATLFSRVERPLEVPAELGPLAPVLERAGRPAPEERWPDAGALGAALAEAATRLSPPGPLLLARSDPATPDPHPTQITAPASAGAGPPAGAAPTVRPAPAPDAQAEPRRSRTHRPRRTLLPIVILALALLAAAGAAIAVGRAGGPRARVPNLVGRSEVAARTAADKAGLEVRGREVSSEDPAGTVISQRPDPGDWLGRGRAVVLTVSNGPPAVPLPAFAGKPAAEVRAALEAADYDITERRAYDENVPPGAVAGTDPPAGQPLRPGDPVAMIVSDGPAPVEVPAVEGTPYAEAVKALEVKGFAVRKVERFDDDVAAGEVIDQSPGAGNEAARDSTVVLTVSKGPDVVEVPDVRGEKVEDAVEILQRVGFEVDVVGYRPGRRVKQQDPDDGDVVRRGETITLYL